MTTLNGALPETVAAFNALSDYAASQGMSVDVANFGGVRTLADTNQILGYRQADYTAALNAGQIRPDTTLQQFRPIAPFGSSFHNYGAAFDVIVSGRPSTLSYDQAVALLGRYAPSIGLRWGGLFRNPDPPHFELAITLADAQARYKAMLAGGGGGGSILDQLSNFDLSSFLPGLTPSTDTAPTLDTPPAPDTIDIADESGDIAIASGPPQAPGASVPLIALGLVIAGVIAWAIRRKFR
jgi:D-alanyl-D-alanine carboxypeptidase-like protein